MSSVNICILLKSFLSGRQKAFTCCFGTIPKELYRSGRWNLESNVKFWSLLGGTQVLELSSVSLRSPINRKLEKGTRNRYQTQLPWSRIKTSIILTLDLFAWFQPVRLIFGTLPNKWSAKIIYQIHTVATITLRLLFLLIYFDF